MLLLFVQYSLEVTLTCFRWYKRVELLVYKLVLPNFVSDLTKVSMSIGGIQVD